MEFIKSLISSNALNYQAILEKVFFDFLTVDGASQKTKENYRSDFRHFALWTITLIKNENNTLPSGHEDFLALITTELITKYKSYLVSQNIPTSTINRRLSTIRAFIRCCTQYGLIANQENIRVQNIIEAKEDKTVHQTENLLEQWRRDLERQGSSKSTVKNYMTDVKKFLDWMQRTTT